MVQIATLNIPEERAAKALPRRYKRQMCEIDIGLSADDRKSQMQRPQRGVAIARIASPVSAFLSPGCKNSPQYNTRGKQRSAAAAAGLPEARQEGARISSRSTPHH